MSRRFGVRCTHHVASASRPARFVFVFVLVAVLVILIVLVVAGDEVVHFRALRRVVGNAFGAHKLVPLPSVIKVLAVSHGAPLPLVLVHVVVSTHFRRPLRVTTTFATPQRTTLSCHLFSGSRSLPAATTYGNVKLVLVVIVGRRNTGAANASFQSEFTGFPSSRTKSRCSDRP